MEQRTLTVTGSATRCPYCHDELNAESETWVACAGCLARHHEACWGETGTCATCAGGERLTRERPLTVRLEDCRADEEELKRLSPDSFQLTNPDHVEPALDLALRLVFYFAVLMVCGKGTIALLEAARTGRWDYLASFLNPVLDGGLYALIGVFLLAGRAWLLHALRHRRDAPARRDALARREAHLAEALRSACVELVEDQPELAADGRRLAAELDVPLKE